MVTRILPAMVFAFALFWWGLPAAAQNRQGLLTGGADPSIVAANNPQGQLGYYVVSTGRGIKLSYSPDLTTWRPIGRIFSDDVPRWAKEEVPRSDGVWAPDLSFHDGLYYLYYSVSSFGSQRSVIGLAVNKAIDPGDPDYQWIDRGKVIESHVGRCDYNTIDPALFVDHDGKWFLFFGSFWSGIKVIELDPGSGKPRPGAEIKAVAARPKHPTHAVEAPYVISRGGYYYLFVSWDRCCDGADSDYNVVVGRSKGVLGPYLDAEGQPMLDGGGTEVLVGNDRWRRTGTQQHFDHRPGPVDGPSHV